METPVHITAAGSMKSPYGVRPVKQPNSYKHCANLPQFYVTRISVASHVVIDLRPRHI